MRSLPCALVPPGLALQAVVTGLSKVEAGSSCATDGKCSHDHRLDLRVLQLRSASACLSPQWIRPRPRPARGRPTRAAPAFPRQGAAYRAAGDHRLGGRRRGRGAGAARRRAGARVRAGGRRGVRRGVRGARARAARADPGVPGCAARRARAAVRPVAPARPACVAARGMRRPAGRVRDAAPGRRRALQGRWVAGGGCIQRSGRGRAAPEVSCITGAAFAACTEQRRCRSECSAGVKHG